MATLYKEGVEGKYKWLTPKQAKKYGIPFVEYLKTKKQ